METRSKELSRAITALGQQISASRDTRFRVSDLASLGKGSAPADGQ